MSDKIPMGKFKETFRSEIPAFLRDRYQLTATVIFTALFSVVFMLVSIPFSHNAWFQLGASKVFFYTIGFFALSLGIMITSKRVMYATRNKLRLSYLNYVLWNLAEIIAICILYTAFSKAGDKSGIIDLSNESVTRIFFHSLLYAFSSILIPYIIAGMYFAIIDKNNTIRLMNYQNVVSDEPLASSAGQKITLFDNSGVMKMSVSLSNLYYIESDDNYIKVWYTDSKGELQRYMLRCRLKTVEESFKGSSLVRCHRKYIVNLDKVKVLRKEKDGYELDLENDSINPIPITKTYAQNVLGRFSARS